jgi:hypothetical protein
MKVISHVVYPLDIKIQIFSMSLEEPADKTRIFQTLLKIQNLTYLNIVLGEGWRRLSSAIPWIMN